MPVSNLQGQVGQGQVGASRSMRMEAFGLCAMMFIGPVFYGCATTDELDAMRATMNASINANKRSVDGRMHQLEESKKKLDEQQAQLVKLTKDAVQKIADVERSYQSRLDSHQGSMSRLTNAVRANMGELNELRQGLQNEQGAIARVLDAEEAFHSEGLRSVQAIRHDLAGTRGRYYKRAVPMRRDVSEDLSFDDRYLR